MEIRTFLLMLVGGFGLAFFLDLYRAAVKALLVKGLLLHFLDFLVAMFSLFLVFILVLIGNGGSLRLYIFLGLAGGYVIYRLLLDRKILNRALAFFRKLKEKFHY